MGERLMPQVVEIKVGDCRPAKAARVIAPGRVLALADSFKLIGLLQPISVRKVGPVYEVIAGGHRLEAAKTLEWTTIPAFVRDDNDLQAELALIDENLIRNELSPAERAIAVARRKKIYEALHPETRPTSKGGEGRKKATRRQHGDDTGNAERFSKATAKATGASERSVQRDANRGETLGGEALAKVIGTSLDHGDQIDALAKLTPARAANLIEKAAAGETVNAVAAVKAEKREAKEAELGARTVALPLQKFNVIYADPPWRFEPYSRETGMDRAPENHYPTMTLEALLDLPVPTIAADDAIIFMWATAPMFLDALYVMEAWGFLSFRPRDADGKLLRDADGKLIALSRNAPRYVTQQIWGKDRVGTGYWFRNRHEILIVGIRGDIPAPTPGTQAESLIMAAVKDHSRKPLIFKAMIEGLFPNLPKTELFSRQAKPSDGWSDWGKEAPAQPLEEDIDGNVIPLKSAEEKREYKLFAEAIEENRDPLDIPEFLLRPQKTSLISLKGAAK